MLYFVLQRFVKSYSLARRFLNWEEEEVDANTGTVELDSDEDEAYEEDETVTVGGDNL